MILDLLRRRCSVRQFSSQPLPPQVLADILEAGRLSPSGGNEQPWRFGVIDERELIATLAKAAYGQSWLKDAAVLIVLCTTIIPDERGGRGIQLQRYPRWANAIAEMDLRLYGRLNQEEHQTKIPGTHMTLAALEHGVGATWVSWFDVERVAEILALPADCLPAEMLALGYPAKPFAPHKKKELAEIVFYNRWGTR